jgi:hypothetical protein
MESLFISYRRDDSQGFAGRLADDLAVLLGPQRVFSDIEIPPGSDFGDVLHRAIAACDALLVVIGRRWAAESNGPYPSRLFEPDDWVRTEIESAFALNKVVVPVLVGGAAMPPAAALPDGIRPLVRVQAATLDDRHWDTDLARLVQQLRTLVPALAGAAAAAPQPEPPLQQVLREIAERVDERVGERAQPPAPASRPGLLPRLLRSALRRIWRGLRGVLTLALVVAAVWVGMRLFGDAQTLRSLDAFEARLQLGWERLQRYVDPR